MTAMQVAGYFTGDTGSGSKASVLVSIIRGARDAAAIKRILVVGCGDGSDAASIADAFKCRVTGVDLNNYFKAQNTLFVDFQVMDACNLQFPAASFDLVYSFHALEHIPDYKTAIAEIRRVLVPGGIYCIGTPNRTRALGYIGVPGYPIADRIKSNLRDWSMRLRGRFRNEFGAHAGFSGRELADICAAIGPGLDVSDKYYSRLYSRRIRIIHAIVTLRLQWCAWPSVYILGHSGTAGPRA